jgi:hypothetical protein
MSRQIAFRELPYSFYAKLTPAKRIEHLMNDLETIQTTLKKLRLGLDSSFSTDTAVPGTLSTIPSAGHCAAVTVIVKSLLGGDLLSTKVQGISHWVNRLYLDNDTYEVDLTGDQFGYHTVQISPNELYPDETLRSIRDINEETFNRAEKLAKKIESNLGARNLYDSVRALRESVGQENRSSS